MQSPLSPPVPYSDFQFSFDPQLSNLFPQPPQLPPSAELFSPSETSELFNFLDGFDGNFLGADAENLDQNLFDSGPDLPPLPSHAPYSNPHLNTVPDSNPVSFSRPRRSTRSSAVRSTRPAVRSSSKSSSRTSSSSTTPPTPEPSSPTVLDSPPTPTQSNISIRSKPLLSTPQKRLNHIMSEQKRRNAIRDGYAQLIALLAPPNATSAALGMPTRGRPKGSGTRGKSGKTQAKDGDGAKGKSGVLFRAVEYCRWLEEGRDALRREVAKVEAAAGLFSS
ncbi:hypothetical protein D9757_002304 [Collybiopsis confluens]|uniref:BHLH domain-containing protein n=1 Tax=Collybiopsis confluens TaxID=2823264 RepID=A0A8H5MFU6_9AGAR|nr:hypothetical protein D9757_002304 [Collybiopsis confluens]